TGLANMILGADPNDLSAAADTKNSTYIGLTKISQGTLYLNKQPGTNAIAGPIELNGGTLVLLQPRQIADTSNLLLSGGLFDVNGKSDTVKTINNTGAEIRVINGGSLATQN